MADGFEIGGAHNEANPIALADDRARAIREYAAPMFNELNPGIVRPEIQAPHFELKPVMFQMLQTLRGVSEEALRLKLFPFSLRDRARAWLNTLPPDSVINWNDLAEKFLRKYFPPTRNAKFRSEIMSFQQLEDETTSDAWERFKELLRKCPHHGIPHCIQLETFYNGLNAASRMVLDASANGAILSKSYNEAFEILERIASNNYQWSTNRAPTSRKVAGVLEVDALTALTAQMASMTNILKNMNMGGSVQPAAAIQRAEISCVYCGDGHTFENCPSNPASVCYVGNQNFNRNNNPYSNSYNPAWKHHPNFSWGGQGACSSGAQQAQGKQSFPPGFSQQPHQPQGSQTSSLESLMRDYMAKNDAVIQSQAASLRNLEVQLGQLLANDLKNRPQGTLPSDTENPRRDCKEHCKAVTLRSGKIIESNVAATGSKEPSSIQKEGEMKKKPATSAAEIPPVVTASNQHFVAEKSLQKPPPPFPQRFKKQQDDGQFRRFLDVLKQLHINIPLVEALEQMPTYVKFLKDILTKKKRLGEFETVALTEGCSAMLKSKIPPKLKDPGSFTIPISIGGRDVGRALCDLGATRPTTVTLQLADRSMAHPEGKIEDVLVQVDKFIFPADFIILDYEEDREVPIILGRPFLATGRTLIDVEKGELTMRAQDEQATFKVFHPMRAPDAIGECLAIGDMNPNRVEESKFKNSKKVRKKIPLKEIAKDHEPQESKDKTSFDPKKPPKKKRKKKKFSRKFWSQMFEVGQQVIFANSLTKATHGRLDSRCDGSFLVVRVYPDGVVELRDALSRRKFLVKGQGVKFGSGEVDRAKTSITLEEA
ncbi:uncharacterized protein LOC133030995 [Cannabis sativa]|uniref:uncharacterized protein LOC133030995 n=1 Tax=Cannabis sativa TaxID=3483 RepID=UPI0029CA5D3A|nr:uncharacterized protein LOC133030995 [Cannabis sativa]